MKKTSTFHSTPVYDYFSDVTEPPTAGGLIAYMNQAAEAMGGDGVLNVTSQGYDDASGAIRFTVDLAAVKTGEVCISTEDLSGELSSLLTANAIAPLICQIILKFLRLPGTP